MDRNEMVALSIVALAALLVLRHFISTRGGGGCCGPGCLPKLDKKNPKNRSGDPK